MPEWEAGRGLDPYGYGYNQATPDGMHMPAEEIVTGGETSRRIGQTMTE